MQRLVRLVGEEQGVHAFIHRATADQGVVEEARAMTLSLLQGQPLSPVCVELCRRHGVPEPLLRARLWAVASLFPGPAVSGGDPYEILGVEPTTDADTIKSAFRRLCLQCHPDLNQDDPEAATRFQQLKAAYDMVSEPSGPAAGFGPPDGSGVWVEPICEEPRTSTWRRMRHLLPLGLVVVFLVLAVGFADLLVQRPRSRSLSRDAASVMVSEESRNLSAAGTVVREPLVLPAEEQPKSETDVAGVAEQRVAPGNDQNASSRTEALAGSSADAKVSGMEAQARPEGELPLAGRNVTAAHAKQPESFEAAARPLRSIRIEGVSKSPEPVGEVSGLKREALSAKTEAVPVVPPDSASTAKARDSQAFQQPVPVAAAPAPVPEPQSQSSAPKAPDSGPARQSGASFVAGGAHLPPASPVPSGPTGRGGAAVPESPTRSPVVENGGVREGGSVAEAPSTPDKAVQEGASGQEAAPVEADASVPAVEEKRADVPPAPSALGMLAASAPVVDVAAVEERLMRFLDAYARDYSRRDLFAFMAHFTPQAQENSKPVKTLLPAYQKNFRTITSMDYRIEVDRWTIHDEGILFEGTFRLHGNYADGRSFASQGHLSMDLVPSDSTYRVRNLTYSFR